MSLHLHSALFNGMNEIQMPDHTINLTDAHQASTGVELLVSNLWNKESKSAKEVTKSFNEQIKIKIKDLNTAFKELKVTHAAIEKMEKKETKLQDKISELREKQLQIAKSLAALPEHQKEGSSSIKDILSYEFPADPHSRGLPLLPKATKAQRPISIEKQIKEYMTLKQKVKELGESTHELQVEMQSVKEEMATFKHQWRNASRNLENLNMAVYGKEDKKFKVIKDLDKANGKISIFIAEIEYKQQGQGAQNKLHQLKQRFTSIVGREIFGFSLSRKNVEDKLSKLKEIKEDLDRIEVRDVYSKIKTEIKEFDKRLSLAIRRATGQEAPTADLVRSERGFITPKGIPAEQETTALGTGIHELQEEIGTEEQEERAPLPPTLSRSRSSSLQELDLLLSQTEYELEEDSERGDVEGRPNQFHPGVIPELKEMRQNIITLKKYVIELRLNGEKEKADELETLMNPANSAHDIYVASRNRKGDEKFQEMVGLLMKNFKIREEIKQAAASPEDSTRGEVEGRPNLYQPGVIPELKEMRQNIITLKKYVIELRLNREKEKAAELETLMNPATSVHEIYVASRNRQGDGKFQEMVGLLMNNVRIREEIKQSASSPEGLNEREEIQDLIRDLEEEGLYS